MDIFSSAAQANNSTTNGMAIEEPTLPGAPVVQLAAVPAPAPARNDDPHQGLINKAVSYMAEHYWGKGLMTGDLLRQWSGYYTELLNGAPDALSVSRAAHLADYAFMVALNRQNRKS